MRTGPLVKRQQPEQLAHNIIERRPLSYAVILEEKKTAVNGGSDIRITAASPDNLPHLSTVIDLFLRDTFSLFHLSFPELQQQLSDRTEQPFKPSLEKLAKLPQQRALLKLFQWHLSRDAILLTVQRGGDLLAATLLRPLWNIPDTLEILAFGINWNAPGLASLLLDTPLSPHASGIEFLPTIRQREYLSQHLLHISISKLTSTNSGQPSLFTVVNHAQQRHMHHSHLSLLGCYSVGTLNVRGKRAQTHSHHIFALPIRSMVPAKAAAIGRVLPGRQLLREHRIPHHKRRDRNISAKKTYIPECMRPSLMNVIENHRPLMSLHYEITQSEITQSSSHIKDSGRPPLRLESERLVPLGLHTCQLTKKANQHQVEALHRSGKDLMAILPLASGETYGIFGEDRTVRDSKNPPVRKKRNQYSTNDVAMSMTPHISIEQENNTDYFCSDQSEPEMIPS